MIKLKKIKKKLELIRLARQTYYLYYENKEIQ
jgi:hypothetical protein